MNNDLMAQLAGMLNAQQSYGQAYTNGEQWHQFVGQQVGMQQTWLGQAAPRTRPARCAYCARLGSASAVCDGCGAPR